MKTILKIIFVFIYVLTSFNLQAQLMQEPRVDNLNQVSFVIHAPDANEVKLINLSDDMAMGAKTYSFSKQKDGEWTLTTNPCRPGIHYFEISIDGARVAYPGTHHYFGWAKWSSMVEVPDKKLDFYHPKNVPHGEIRQHYYFSDITQKTRKCLVYTPPGYDEETNVRYPVLYLQHGSGESELGWTMQGKVNFILDNLIAEGKAKPFLVVMDNGYAPGPDAENQFNPRGDENLFTDLMVKELIPLIDANYRTLPNKENRAISGLSMGGGQAMRIGFDHPELFGTVGSFSGGGRISKFNVETAFNGIFKDPAKFNSLYSMFFIGCGTLETGYDRMKGMYDALKNHGINTVFSEPVGSHEWQVWRVHLYDFAQMVFQK